jgi:hypothetical protein
MTECRCRILRTSFRMKETLSIYAFEGPPRMQAMPKLQLIYSNIDGS